MHKDSKFTKYNIGNKQYNKKKKKEENNIFVVCCSPCTQRAMVSIISHVSLSGFQTVGCL